MCFIFFQVARRSDVVVLPLDLRIVVAVDVEELEWTQSDPWCAEKDIFVAAHLSQNLRPQHKILISHSCTQVLHHCY